VQSFCDLPERTVSEDVEREGGEHAKEGLGKIVWWEVKAIANIDWGEEVGRGQFALIWVFFTELQPRPIDALDRASKVDIQLSDDGLSFGSVACALRALSSRPEKRKKRPKTGEGGGRKEAEKEKSDAELSSVSAPGSTENSEGWKSRAASRSPGVILPPLSSDI